MAEVYEMQRPAYDAVARTLHWLTVLLVAMQFVIGWTMPDVHKGTQPVNLIAWHLGVGATLVAVMAIRVIWRLTHWPTPDELPLLLSVVSRITHVLLYAALVLYRCSAGSTRPHAAGRSGCWAWCPILR